MNLINKKLAADLAASIETSLDEFIEIQVNKSFEAITKSNEIWSDFSIWLEERLNNEIKHSVIQEELLKKQGFVLNQLEQEGFRRGLVSLRNDVKQWKEWQGTVSQK
jgi:hypothetical protein